MLINKYADNLTSAPELLTGTYFFDFVHDHEKSELSGIYYSLTVEHPSQTYSHEAIVGDKTVWHQWTGRALFNDSGTLLGYQAIGLDITEQKEAQKEKELLQGQLIQAQKMESVGRLAGGIAHDFNNMLSVIMGEAEILMMGLDPTHPHYDNLKDIRKAALRSADLTRQLLAFARKQVIAPQVLNLNDTIEGMLKILRRLIGEDIELTLQPGNELWLVKVDPGQIDQILANLCVNARDAISIDGQIEIETGNVTISKKDCKNHPGLKPDEYVFLSVHDNGCGMNEDTLNKIFEPFFTTKSIGKGTGLGLATVYGIVKQNNGFIHAQSAYGNGSTFIIYFPRFSGEEQPSIVQPNQQNSASGSEKILLVEDDPDHLKTCTRILESLGYTVKSSENPNEALIVAEINKDIDLIITDIVMPQMNGSELASKVDTIIPGIKKLFMSGYPTDVIVDQGILSKQINYIHKPFSIKDLADIIRDVIEGKPKN